MVFRFFSVQLPKHCFQFRYLESHSNKQTFVVGRAYYCQLILYLISLSYEEKQSANSANKCVRACVRACVCVCVCVLTVEPIEIMKYRNNVN